MSAQPDEITALKQEVFGDVLAWFAAGSTCVLALVVVQLVADPGLWTNMLLPLSLAALLPFFLILRRVLGYPRTAIVFLAYLQCTCLWLLCWWGLTPGLALASATFLMLSGMLFGRKGAIRAVLATCVSLLIAGICGARGFASDWDPDWWNPKNPIVWLRYTAVLTFFGGALLSAFIKLFDGLTHSAATLRSTLERERAERIQREHAEEALGHARRLEALAQFAGGLAHDFNNTLMVIMSGSTLLAEDAQASERVRAVAADITRSAESGAQLVRHLLALGRNAPPEPKDVSVDAIIQQCRSTLRKVLPEAVQLEIEVHTQASLRVDIAGMQQALLNLALNARDALGSGGSFTLRAEQRVITDVPAGFRAEPGVFVVISCEDTGSGMDEATRSRLFEPFFTTKASGKGTGLGLPMVRHLIYEAGGFITVESQKGVGTAFRLHFPAVDPAGANTNHLSLARGPR